MLLTSERGEIDGATVDLYGAFEWGSDNPCLTECTAFAGFQKGGSRIEFEAPPQDVINEFFASGGLPLPDPGWSCERMNKELL